MIEILSGSTCDLPQPLLEQYRITVLPHFIIWGSQQFRDRVDLQPADFYRRLESDSNLPSTSAVTEIAFLQAFQSLRAGGANEIVALILNAGFSGAYQNAVAATRTRRRAVEEFYQRFFQTIDPGRPFRVAVSHGAAPEDAARLIERIRQETHPLEIVTNITGPVLGINTGPRALALAGYNE